MGSYRKQQRLSYTSTASTGRMECPYADCGGPSPFPERK